MDKSVKCQTLLGDWLPETLPAFLAGGGDLLTERTGEGEADTGGGRFRVAGGGETDLEDGLLISWGLGDCLWWVENVTSNQTHKE